MKAVFDAADTDIRFTQFLSEVTVSFEDSFNGFRQASRSHKIHAPEVIDIEAPIAFGAIYVALIYCKVSILTGRTRLVNRNLREFTSPRLECFLDLETKLSRACHLLIVVGDVRER
mgnify:CR=1 FL=1